MMQTEDYLKLILEGNGIFYIPEDKSEKLELDSIEFVSIICDIEETFRISIPTERILSLKDVTIQSLADLIREQLNQKK